MSPNAEANKATVRRFVDLVKNQQKLDMMAEIFHPNYKEHDPVIAGCGPGIEGYKKFLTQANEALPGHQITLDLMVAEGDLVVFIGKIKGTHMGPFLGVPPTGKTAVWTEVQGFRFEDGRVAEHWVYADVFAFLQQLGVIPPPQPVPDDDVPSARGRALANEGRLFAAQIHSINDCRQRVDDARIELGAAIAGDLGE